jgi:hypothetical protein
VVAYYDADATLLAERDTWEWSRAAREESGS